MQQRGPSARSVKVWAWSDGVRNFGDELGPLLLERLGYAVTRVPHIAQADILTIGSLIEHAAQYAAPGTIVWGSGVMHDADVDISHLDVRAVRGLITARRTGCRVPTADPAALVPLLWNRTKPRYGVGVVRHYIDTRAYPWADIVIDATGDVEETIHLIGACRRIASSSLHGLIVAASWGIPVMRLHHPGVAGGDTKWADWLTGTGPAENLLPLLP